MPETEVRSFRLIVVKPSFDGFQVSHYYKSAPTPEEDILGVIAYMTRLHPNVLRAEPQYVNVSTEDQILFERIRVAMIERSERNKEPLTELSHLMEFSSDSHSDR